MNKRYTVEAIWDPEAGVYYAKTDIPGLNVEAATVAEFIEIVKDVAPELIEANEPKPATHSRSVRFKADLALA
jgi:hypothetical protein